MIIRHPYGFTFRRVLGYYYLKYEYNTKNIN